MAFLPEHLPLPAPLAGIDRMISRTGVRTRMLMLIGVAVLPAFGVLVADHRLVTGLSRSAPGEAWLDAVALLVGMLLLGGGLISVGFGVVVGEHFLRRPTEAVLRAAERLSAGDFDTRIDMTEATGGEFARIARAFNQMAETLGRQRAALQAINAELEGRVEDRTRELSESHQLLLKEMSERERAEAALRQSQKLQAIGQLAGGIAHDFNNLLTTILGALDLLRGRAVSQGESTLRLVDTAIKAAERGGRLTEQLLTFARRRNLAPAATDMNATINALMEMLANTLGPQVRIDVDLADDLWPAMVDPAQVEAALLNLAFNARDAMPDGGTLTIATTNLPVAGRPNLADGDYVAIQVSDTGVGMSDEVAAKAFEPFFTTKGPGEGPGLGLSQVHGLATQSGGDVRLRSVPGMGTTVSLLLPRAADEAPAAIGDLRAPAAPPRWRARILVVDDEQGVRDMAADMLRERGYQVETAECAERALAMLGDARFDLMLTDFVMSGMNGLRLIQETSEAWPAMRTVLMTGHTDLFPGDAIGPERLIRKPFNGAILDERVRAALGRPRLQVIEGGAAASA